MFRARSCPLSIVFAIAILIAQFAIAGAALSQTSDEKWGEKCAPYASVPLPAEAEKAVAPKKAPACASYKSYRGIGRPVNFTEARSCAWEERLAQKADLGQNGKEPTAWVVGGSLILADIYYNGAGVKKNVPLAMRLACEGDQQMAVSAMSVVPELNGTVPAGRRFEFCDYAWTTFMANFCMVYRSEIEDDRRNREYERLKVSMTPEQRQAFDKLLSAESRYIEQHAEEVDQGGTIHVMRTLGSEKILNDLFHAEIIQFERKAWPALSAKQIAVADVLLRREYENALQRIQAENKDEIEEGAVTADGLANAEAAWKSYRDAWIEFARARYPAKAAGVGAEVTFDRFRLLTTIR